MKMMTQNWAYLDLQARDK